MINNKLIRGVLLIAVGLGLVFVALFFSDADTGLHEREGVKIVKINDALFEVDVSDTTALRTQGLSGREFLNDNEGMLFVFDTPKILGFWMKDMNFPIDIIWIDENKKIVDISKNVLAESYPDTFSPSTPAKYVLEVNSGISDEKGINIGDTVLLSL